MWYKLRQVREQKLALNGDVVIREQHVNAFSVRLPARQQEAHYANAPHLWTSPVRMGSGGPIPLVVFHLLHAIIIPWTEPSVSHRWKLPWSVPIADGPFPSPGFLFVRDVHMKNTLTKSHGQNDTPDIVW